MHPTAIGHLVEQLVQLFCANSFTTNTATLHCHTYYSDGIMSPVELIDTAARQGFHTLSITDHDTTAAYTRPLSTAQPAAIIIEYARAHESTLIPGIELTCWWRWHPVHILAYGLDPSDEHTLRLCHMCERARNKRIMFRWSPVQAMTVCQLVLALGGVSVLAHPRFYWVNVPRMIEELVEFGGLTGVETEYEYRTHHRRLQCPLWTPGRIIDMADRSGLVRTGGADSHGRDLTKYR